MPKQNMWTRLSLVPGWIGLLCGALPFVGASEAHATRGSEDQAATPDWRLAPGEVLIKAENDSIYLSEDGATFDELPLADSPSALRLKHLLRDASERGLRVVRVSPTMLADGAGGFHWTRPSGQTTPDPATDVTQPHGKTQPTQGTNSRPDKQGG
ncbi:MAG TPA: hypothetical protein VFL55_22930 [Acetobacteraceae bacterium]|nr:hypothetical protein [Acetobacteraceae bacterium]